MNELPITVVLCVVFLLAGCPSSQPTNDDTSKPADGETGGSSSSSSTGTSSRTTPEPGAAPGDGDGDQTCEAELERVKADLAECKGAK